MTPKEFRSKAALAWKYQTNGMETAKALQIAFGDSLTDDMVGAIYEQQRAMFFGPPARFGGY